MSLPRLRSAPLVALLATSAAFAQEGGDYSPVVQPASEEGRAAMESFTVADGLEVELFASEPMLANPVALYVDGKGRLYVAETFRHYAGVTDVRDHMDWLDDDLASRTVEDRLDLLRRHEGERFPEYAQEHERVRLILDEDGDGSADSATVYADGFNHPLAGIGAGLLAHSGDVYFTCIPDLWKLRDTDGDGRADERRALSTGYGVHIALLGHDLHGLRIGPDGRLYFTSGDRGFVVHTENGVLDHSHAGAVLRCELDGSNLEIFATGLRNPQELAFDDFGNLFTGDNNSDGGDKARWVHLVEGGDSGWRYAYQWIEAPVARGPWNDEKLWYPHFPGQAAYLVPPIANLGHGPSGLTHYPGTGLGPEYAGHFFLCDFRGNPKYSGVHDISVTPKGASFELGPVEQLVWGTLVTDVDFGPDGALYFCDWVQGWNKTGKGRVYRLLHPEGQAHELTAETRTLLAEGMAGRGADELAALLGHVDQRVRLEAQLALAERPEGAALFTRAATSASSLLARVHGVWGLWIVGRAQPEALAALEPLLADPDPEIRAQAIRVLGDLRHAPAAGALGALLADPIPRVQLFAALAARRLASAEAVDALVALLDATGESDPVLRHGAVMGLLGCADLGTLRELRDHASPDVRLGSLLALRRQASPAVAHFLEDSDELLVLEAARAIHDVPIPAALPALARLVENRALEGAALGRRVLNANNRLGDPRSAQALALFARRSDANEELRVEALDMLAAWAEPPARDRVMGDWRPLATRDASFLAELAAQFAPDELDALPEALLDAWIRLARAADHREAAPQLERWLVDEVRPTATRVAAFEALEAFESAGFAATLDLALGDRDGQLRAAALVALERVSPQDALPRLPAILRTGELAERRSAYQILSRIENGTADEMLAGELAKLAADLVPAELALDLVLATEDRSEELQGALDVHQDPRQLDPQLAAHLDCLFGGNRGHGSEVFHHKQEVSCRRCHTIGGTEEPGVGPDLAGVGERLSRLQILESILVPNRRTTPGYEATALFLTDGTIVAGRVLREDAEALRVQTADGQIVDVAAEDVDERRPDLSAMPQDAGEHLSRAEMRDLIEYLSSL